MKSGLESIRNRGLKVSTNAFNRIKAFQGGGDYWDNQTLIRDSLGEFLPPLEQVVEGDQRNGVFRKLRRDREVLWKSVPVSKVGVPEQDIRRLTEALATFKKKAEHHETTPSARDIITHFRLPDISKDPDLYRITGPWWDRKLQVLWGFERVPDSSLNPSAAIAKLPVDKAYQFKRWAALACLVCLLLLLLTFFWQGLPAARNAIAKALNEPPAAAVKLDSLNENELLAVVSDAGSKDPDGTLQRWRIDWGDGNSEEFSSEPRAISHKYNSERDYQISLSCYDNHGATSAPPASVLASFNLKKQQAAIAEANRAAEEIKLKAQEEADRTKQQAALAAEAAEKFAAKAKADQELAAEELAAAQKAREEAEEQPEPSPAPQQVADAAGESRANGPPAEGDTPSSPDSTNPEVGQDLTAAPGSQQDPAPPAEDALAGAPEQSDAPPTSGKPKAGGDNRKGAQRMLDPRYEIVKAGVGQFGKNGTLQVMLVVRDKESPNRAVNVQEWQCNDRVYKSRNTQLTLDLPVGSHVVKVLVRPSASDPQWQNAQVIVKSDVRQTTEADFTVNNY